MAFREVIEQVKPLAIRRLLARASLTNRLAKTVGGVHRAQLYRQKCLALSHLIVLGTGTVEEILVGRDLVTVSLPGRGVLHAPIGRLSLKARGVVLGSLRSRLTDDQETEGRA